MHHFLFYILTALLCLLHTPIQADDGKKISGKVTDLSNGSALSAVTIEVKLGGVTVATKTTNSQGNYNIGDLAPGIYTVTASLANYQTATTSNILIVTSSATCNFQLSALGSISGNITNSTNSAAISGATVQMIQSGTVIKSTTTASNGSYSITGLAPGSYTLSVSASQFQSNTAAVSITSNTTTTRNLSLTPNTGAVSGTISSSPSSLGLAGATLTFTLNGSTVATTTSGLLGAYSVSGLAPATYSVSINLANYQTATRSVTITSNTTASLNVSLIPLTGTLSGTVKDAVTNATLAGATITVKQGSTTIKTGTSDSQGNYSISDLSPGNYTVTTSSTNYQALNSSVTITSNQTTTLNPLLQPLPGNIVGVITNSQTSAALAGATVTVSSGAIIAASTTTNSSGNYSISSLAAGSYTLTVSLNNFVAFSQNITVAANTALTQNCTLTPQLGIVTGIVQDLNSLSLLGGATVELLQGSTVVASTTTTIAGLYSFSVLPGSYTIRVNKTNYATVTVSATVLSNVSATVNITLIANPGTATGTITDALSSAALSGASVQVLNGSSVIASTTTNASGIYTLTGISPGTYQLSVGKTNYTTASTSLIIVSGQTTTTNLALQPQNGTAAGLIKNAVTSANIQGATVEFYQGSILKGSTTTDANGNYSLTTLAPGSYTLKVSATNTQSAQQAITIQSNLTTTTNVNLQPTPGSVSGTITNAQTSAALNGATITLSQGAVVIATTSSNQLGAYAFTNVVPGSYLLTASLTNFTSSSQSITVNPNSTTSQNLSLQPQSGTLSGQITSSLTAAALANVTVNAFQGSTLIATTTTNISGAYSFNLSPGSYTLSTLLTNYQAVNQSASVQSNATTTLNLSLTPIPGSLTGIVTSASTSLPLAAVNVVVLQGATTVASVQTNALGTYTIANLSPGNYTVQFSLNNYQTTSQSKTIVANAATTADAALQLQPGSASGIISNAQTSVPINNATVTAVQGASIIASTTSGSNGSYTLPNLPPGTYSINATATNFQTASQALVVIAPNATTTVNLNLQPAPGIVSGFITNQTTTNPIAGASVSALQNGITLGSTTSLLDGSYIISGLAPGSYTLVVNAANYQGATQSITITSNVTTNGSVSLQSSPGAISGFVLNSINASPIASATVEVLNGSNVLATTTSALNGSYTISGLAPASSGVYTFRASATNFQTSTTTAAITANTTTPVSFSLAPQPGNLTGTVSNSQSHGPISGANVEIAQGAIVYGSTITNANGVYTFSGLAPGAYTVTLSAANFQTTSQGTNIASNATTTLNVPLTPTPGILSGIITDSVTSAPLNLSLVSVWNQGIFITSTTTLIDGSYSIGGLAPGAYTVTASLANYQNTSLSASIFANQTTTLNLSLAPVSGAISGTVTSGVTPLSSATLTLLQGNNTLATATTNGSGNYSFAGLTPGNYTLVASSNTYQSATSGAIVLSNATTPVNFNLASQPGTITGTLTDAMSQAPISGALITALNGNITIATTLTANDGSYSFAGLSPGAYLVTAAALNYQTQTQGATVQALVTTTVDLKLQSEPGSVSGQITDSVTLAGISGASVTISHGNVQSASVLTDINGYYSATGLPPGTYTVSIQAPLYQNALKGCIILANANTSLNCALVSSPGAISGQVFDSASTPLPGALLNLYANNVLLFTQVADHQGNFTFSHLAPGTYSVTAQTANYQTATQSVIVSANVTSAITFTLQPDPGSCACSLFDALTTLPLSGATVTILQNQIVITSLVTNSLGECLFSGLAPGQYIIRASASNYQNLVQGVSIQSNQTTTLSLSLQPEPGSLSGVISDGAAGSVISGATVDIIQGSITIASALTDNNGAYLVGSLTPGIYSIRVSAANYQTNVQASTIVANTTATLNVNLQPSPGNISVSVTDIITTSPLPGVLITIFNPLSNIALATGITDANGNCLISGIAPGLYNLVATATNYQNTSLSVSVTANTTVPLSLALASDPGSVNCTVLNSVSLSPLTGCLVEALKGTTVITSALTDAAGGCYLLNLAPGSYIIRVTAANYQITTQAVIVSANVQATALFHLLSDPGSLDGEVVDFLSALILPSAQLSLFSHETLVATTLSDPFGNYLFTGIAPGAYTLRVSLLNYEILTLNVTISANQRTHQHCAMHSEPGSITGTVVNNQTSSPIAGAQIVVLNGSTTVANVLTDSSGSYLVAGLASGINYTVRCSADNYQTEIQGAVLQANQVKTVNFSLKAQPGNIFGQVRDATTSQELAGVTVDLLQGSVTIASATTDSSGNYQLTALAPQAYTLRASKALYQTVLSSTQVQANQTRTLNLSLQQYPGSLQGNVVDALSTTPLPNTQIQVRNGTLLVASATTDQNGHYTCEGLPPGQYVVTATMSNYQSLNQPATIQSNAATTLNFSLQPNPGSIIGQVLDNAGGSPLSGASVNVYQSSNPVGSATTDSSGNYLVPNLAPGQYTVVAGANDFQNSSQGVRVQANQSVSANFSLLSQPGIISGTVTGALATLDLLQGSTLIASVATNSDDSYSFTNLAPGSYTLRAQAPDFQTTVLGATVTANATTTINISLQPQPGAISGSVRDENSSPLMNATIELIQNSIVIDSVLTNSLGNYTLSQLAPGNYIVRATFDTYQIAVQGAIVQANTTSTANFSLIPTPGNIAGQVTDAVSGSLIADAQIDVFQGAILIASTLTDGNGNYQLSNLAPSSYTIRASILNYETTLQSALVTATNTTNANFVLTQQPGSVTGQITDAFTTQPITAAAVSVSILQSNVLVGSVLVDSFGYYTINGVSQGSYTLQIAAIGYQTSSQGLQVFANNATTANIALQPQPGILSGKITDLATSQSLVGALVEVMQGGVIFESLLTDASGNYSANQLAQGSYVVRASAAHYQTSTQNAIVLPNATTTANLQLQSDPGSLSGNITNASGSALSGAVIVIKKGNVVINSVVSDASGNYVVTGLPPATYTILVNATNYQAAFNSAIVQANSITELSFTLTAQPGSSNGQIIDAITLLPLPSTTLDFLQNGLVVASVLSDSNGHYTLDGLAPGQYTLRATLVNYQIVNQGIFISSNQTTTTDLSLQPFPGSLGGVITDALTSAPLVNASIQVYQGLVLMGTGMTDSSGTYIVSSLPPGNYTAVVSALNYQSSTEGFSVQSSAATSLNTSLTSDPGAVTGTIKDASTQAFIAHAAIQVLKGSTLIGSAFSDSNGLYTISGLNPGSYTLTVMAANYQSSALTFSVTANQTAIENRALNSEPGILSGIVLDSTTASALAGAAVTVKQGAVIIASQVTDAQGNWTISNLAPGSYTIVVSASSYQTNVQGAFVLANTTTTATIALTANPGSVSGQVTSNSITLTGALVEVLQNFTIVATALTDSSGNYTIDSLAPGSYSIRASSPNFNTPVQGLIIISNQTATAHFSLDPNPGSLAGQMTDAISMEPLSLITIHVIRANVLVASATTDLNGNYQIEGLTPGNYTVTTASALYQTVSQGAAIVSNQPTTLNLALHNQPGGISGHVNDQATGLSLSGASITVTSGSTTVATTLSDSNGNYIINGLSPGSYTVRIALDTYQTMTQSAIVPAAVTTPLNASLVPNPGSVAGSVKDVLGFPITGCSVVLHIIQGNVVLASTLTDQDGFYLINNLPAGNYSLSVMASGYQSTISGVTIQQGATSTVDFTLAFQPGKLEGTVQDQSGPLAGATIQLLSNTSLIASVLSDQLGHYQISNLAPGQYVLQVSLTNYQALTQAASITANVTTTADVTLLSNPGSISGSVADSSSGAALVGFVVNVSKNASLVATALTDASGNFAISGLAPGVYSVTASGNTYQTNSLSVNVLASTDTSVSFLLQSQPGQIAGVVSDAASAPIANAIIEIFQGATVFATAQTDANGSYVLSGLAPGNYVIRTSASLFQVALQGANVVAGGQTLVTITLQDSPGSVSGLIQNANSQAPIAGATITVLQNAVPIATTFSQANGQYTISSLPTGNYIIQATALDYQTNQLGMTVAPNAALTVNLSLLPSPGSIQGTVIDQLTSSAISGANLTLFSGSSFVAMAQTDANGNYAIFNLAPGSYTLTASAAAYQTSIQGVSVASLAAANLNFSLSAEPGSISGSLVDQATLPIVGAQIVILHNQLVVANALTDANGNYTVTGLSPNTYFVVVNAANFQSSSQGATVSANTDTNVSFTLSTVTGTISMHVTNSLSEVLAGATIEVLQNQSILASVLTDLSGNASIGNLAPGTYTVRISTNGYQTLVQTVVVVSNQTTSLSSTLLQNPGNLNGTVLDQSTSTPLANALIEILQGSTIISTTLTAADGTFALSGLSSGDYILRASLQNFQTAVVGASIISGETTLATVSLISNPGTASGAITDALSGLGLPGALVEVLQNTTLIASQQTDSNGNYTLNNLAPGNYILRISKADYQSAALPLTIQANQTTSASAALQAQPGSISGTIIDGSTQAPIANATVNVFNGAVLIATTSSDSSGFYSVNSLATGSYLVNVQASGYQTSVSASSVPAGGTDQVSFNLSTLTGSINGVVQDALSAASIGGANISVFQGTVLIASILTDTNGAYNLPNLSPGTYYLIASAANYQNSVQTLSVPANSSVSADISLASSPGSINGQILDASTLLPIPGASIQVSSGQAILASALTSAQGEFIVGNLPTGSYTVTISAANYQTIVQSINLAAAESLTINLSLQGSPGSIFGIISDAQGQPLAGSTVYLWQGSTLISSVLTNTTGVYSLSGIAQGNYTVQATAPAYQFTTSYLTVAAGTHSQADLVLQSNPGSIQGTISDGSNPIANAFVQVFNGNTVLASTFTDSLGNYTLLNLSPGSYHVQASASSFQTAIQGVQITANTATPVNFSLQSLPSSVNGIVTSASSMQPLVGVNITSYQNNILIASVLTNINGQYLIGGLASGNYVFNATSADYQTGISGIFLNPNTTETLNFNLLSQPGSVIGVIRDTNGAPLAGMTITLLQNNIIIATVTTGTDGSYTLPNLSSGSYTATATGTSYQGNTQGIVVIANTAVALDFSLQAQPSTLSGHILDALSNPIPSAQISILQNGSQVANAVSASDGSFNIGGLGVGSFTVVITAAQFQTTTAGIILAAGESLNRNFTLLSSIGSIQGTVQDVSSSPLANATLTISQSSIVITSVITNASGSYTVTNLPQGSYVVTCSLPNYQTASQGAIVLANAITTADFTLSVDAGRLEGTITDFAGGTPVSNATITILSQGIVVATATTDANGYYWIGGLAPNSYTVNVQAINYQTTSQATTIAANATTQTSLGLLANPGNVQGVVQSAQTPIVNALVSVTVFQGNTIISTSLTDSNGGYLLSGLQPGNYVVKASATGYQIQVQGVTVVAAQTAIINFSLIPNPGAISGSVIDAQTSNSIAGAFVQILQGSVVVNSGLTDSSGNFLFTNFAPGTYAFSASADHYQTGTLNVQVASDQTAITSIALQANPGSIAGTVVDSNTSQPISGAVIDLLQGFTLISSTLTDTSGSYTLTGLPPGSYTVRATATNYQISNLGITVSAGSTAMEYFTLTIQPSMIAGTVVDADTSEGIAGASVAILQGNIVVATALTDSTGSFNISGLGYGSYSIQSSSMDYQNNVTGLILSPNETRNVNIALQPNPGSLQGSVKDTFNQPITGAFVSVDILKGNILVAQTLTDINGLYVIENLGEGSYVIQASATNYQTAIQGAIIISNQATTVNFILPANPGGISGTITDSASVGISGATVNILQGPVKVTTAITDSSGNYLVPGLAPGSYTVNALANNYQSAISLVNVAPNIITTANIALQQDPGTLKGIITANDGALLVGAIVDVSLNGVSIASTLTGSDGSYQINGLPIGTYIVTVTGASYQTVTIGATIQAGQTVTQNLSLEPNPGQITGHVSDQSTSQPIANALINLLQNNIIVTSVLSDAQGAFSIQNLAPGSYVLRLSASGFQTLAQNTSVASGQTTGINAALSENPGALQGMVTNASTTPIANISIQVFQNFMLIAETITDSAGAYRIEGLPEGLYSVIAGGQGFSLATASATVESNQATILNFILNTQQGTISGTITEAGTGNSVSGATINIFSGSDLISVTLSDTNGLYTFLSLQPGTYTLRISANGYQTKITTIVITDGENTLADEILEPLPGSLAGRITNAYSTSPVPGVSVTIFAGDLPLSTTQTDANGNYLIIGLPPGGYTVQFSLTNYATTIEDVIIEADSQTTLDITLEPFPNMPASVKQCPIKVVFLTQKEIKTRIQWQPSQSPHVVAYNIYRNHVLLAKVPANRFFYEDHNLSKHSHYTYQVSAVNSFGLESPLVEALPSKTSKCTCASK